MPRGWNRCAAVTISADDHRCCVTAPIDLNLVRMFVAVHETGSFTAAAARFGVPRSTASRAVAALEDQLGVALFQRTTRTVAITEDGSRLFARVAPSLASVDDALADVPDREEEVSGTLRVTAIPDLASVVLAEAVAQLATRYPKLEIDLRLTPAILDLARERIDLALRVQRRPARASSLVARRVGEVAVALFASPAYLARRGTPRTLRDLGEHDGITFGGPPPFEEAGAPPLRRRILCDDMRFACHVTRLGAGIGAIPTFLVAQDLIAGTLVRVLPRRLLATAPVYLVRPSRAHPPRRAVLFADTVAEILQQRPLA